MRCPSSGWGLKNNRMRHNNKNKILKRKKNQRRALIAALAKSLVVSGKIVTTEAKAKALRPIIERMVTHAKANNLSGRRHVLKLLDPETCRKLFGEIGPRLAERKGGYTRILKTQRKRQDRAPAVIMEFV